MNGLAGPVLAVEASSLRPSVALLGPDSEPWGHWQAEPGTRGTSTVAVATHELLAARELDPSGLAGLAVGIGPGSYTGLRASIAFVLGLAWPHRVPVAGVPSVAAAARAALAARPDVDSVTVLIDARRGECYQAEYQRGADRADTQGEPLVEKRAPGLVPSNSVDGLEHGDGRLVLREPVPDALDVAYLALPRLAAGGDDPAHIRPLYLKRSHAEIAFEERARRR